MNQESRPEWWEYLTEESTPKGKNFDLVILLGAIAAVLAVLVVLIILL